MDDKSNIKDLNMEELNAYIGTVWYYKLGRMVSMMIHFGDCLGIYKAMAGAGPLTVKELAERTELNERFLLEWLRGQVAARCRGEMANRGSCVCLFLHCFRGSDVE